VYVRGAAGKGGYADIFAADAKSDLAVLKLLDPPAGMGLKAVTPAEVRLMESPAGQKPTLKRGSFVVTVGHPLAAGAGDGQPSASWGSVTNVRRSSAPPPQAPDPTAAKPLHAYGGLIQLDARVTLGSSGAAVFDLDGKLIALGTAVAAVYGSEANGGYAVPLDAGYRRIVDTLQQGREVEYGFLGVQPTALDGGGARIDAVTPGCPAAAAGIQPNDVITAVDGNPLRDTDDVHLYVGGALADSEVVVEFKRQRADTTFLTRSVKVRLAKNPNPFPHIASVSPPAPFGLAVEYHSVRLMAQQQRGRFGPPRPDAAPPQGVVVRDDKPAPGSDGERQFAALGAAKGYWVITHVDGAPVASPKEFHAATKGKASVKLFVTDADDPTDRRTVVLP
jgi:S1-C subfamily serine protease